MTEDANTLYDVATGNAVLETRVVHARIGGRSHDINFRDLGIHEGSNDGEIKAAVSRHLDTPLENLRNTVVERETNGNISLRPQAVFG